MDGADRLAEIWRYPVKSMAGEQVPAAAITPAGLLGDRGYAVVDVRTGTVASAKNPRLWAALLTWRARYVAEPEPDRPLPSVVVTLDDGTEVTSGEPGTDAVLSGLLGREVTLQSGATRPARDLPSIEELQPDGSVELLPLGQLAPEGTLFDLAPLHLVTTSTLARLTAAAGFEVAAGRFRPNLVVQTAGAGWAEDRWVGGGLRIGAALVSVLLPTMRCVMTTLGQVEVAPRKDMLRVLAAEHTVDIPQLGTFACAGVYARTAETTTVSVGDVVSSLG